MTLLFSFLCHRGNEFLKPLIILDQSILRGADNLDKISEYVAKGDNIVILSNHQTEADPQVFLTFIIAVAHSEISTNFCFFTVEHFTHVSYLQIYLFTLKLGHIRITGEVFFTRACRENRFHSWP
jgi:hypothetical protein